MIEIEIIKTTFIISLDSIDFFVTKRILTAIKKKEQAVSSWQEIVLITRDRETAQRLKEKLCNLRTRRYYFLFWTFLIDAWSGLHSAFH